MNLRKHLLAAGATLAAGALALAPAAQATTPGTAVHHVKVGTSITGNHAITGTLVTLASVTMKIYGANTTLNCYSGSATGTAHAGSPAGAHFKAMSFTALSLNCDAMMPGDTVTISVPANGCAGLWVNDPLKPSVNVHDGLVDSGTKGGKLESVSGIFRVPYNPNAALDCSVTATTSNGCQMKFGDGIEAWFDEAIKPNGSQDLILGGSSLKVKWVKPGLSCGGMVAVNDAVTVNSFRFNIASADGAIDFRTNP